MKFCSLSSGSSGNSVYIATEKTAILIDAGFSGKQVEALLRSIGEDPRKLDLILVTHEHIDHVKGIGVLSRRYNIPVAANYQTWRHMPKSIGAIAEKNRRVYENNRALTFRDLDIFPFSVYHDATDAVGFVVKKDKNKVTVMTDTGYVSDEMKYQITGSQIYYVEANHDIEMLKNGPYPYHLKRRILSAKGHLSNMDCAQLLGEILRGEGESVFLAHLSEENNTPPVAHETVSSVLTLLGMDIRRDVQIEVAHRHRPGRLVIW